MSENAIHDTIRGIQPGIIRVPATANFTDMVQLFWIRNTGEEMKAIFPRKTAEEFLKKHLIPQKDAHLLTDVGIKELEPLGTN